MWARAQIIDCEIVKDKKTGDSLQYAFIGFETKEQAEAAYFKMVRSFCMRRVGTSEESGEAVSCTAELFLTGTRAPIRLQDPPGCDSRRKMFKFGIS